MFEKEADEMAVNNAKKKYGFEGSICMNIQECAYVNGFQQGAEFGYNKANEWHYVKDGDYPKDSGTKLCYIRTAKYVCATYDEKYDCWGFVFNNLEHCIPSSVVIAWKEIVLPKER